ncbi:DNA repair protein XRCC2 [Ooceraea biroi]|nr:DNA repair protein XRCC2 [Ooceraea biroi]
MQFHSEGGLELLSRLNEKPRSTNLDEVLFPDGINSKSIVEITGPSSTGKTVLLCQFIAKCILPARYKGIQIDGCDACAILIDTLGHVQMSKVAELMTSMVCSAYRSAGVQAPAETVDMIVTGCLKNLTVIGCCNSDQFQLALHTLEDEFLCNERITLLAIDNILAYYWQERREKGLFSMDQYTKTLVRIVQAQTCQFSIVTAYTRWDGPSSESEVSVKHTENLLGRTDVNYRLRLCKNNVAREFMCHVESADDTKQIRYTISDNGIKWTIFNSA